MVNGRRFVVFLVITHGHNKSAVTRQAPIILKWKIKKIRNQEKDGNRETAQSHPAPENKINENQQWTRCIGSMIDERCNDAFPPAEINERQASARL